MKELKEELEKIFSTYNVSTRAKGSVGGALNRVIERIEKLEAEVRLTEKKYLNICEKLVNVYEKRES